MMKTTEEVKHDLAVELDDLNGKINRLEAYIRSKHSTEENLLMGQLKAMTDYKFYLIERLSKLGGLN